MDGWLILLFVIGAVLVGFAIVWAQRKAEERQQIWQRVAEARGGRFVPAAHGFLHKQYEGIEVPVGHAIVFLDLFVVSHGKSSTTYTRARARYALGKGPHFSVYEEGVLASIGKALGTQDLEIGVPAFDERFMIKGADARAIREAWTDEATYLMSQLSGARAESEGTQVTLKVLGGITHVETLERMLDLVGELASVGAWELDTIAEEVPDAVLQPAGGDWQAPEPPRVTIETSRGLVEGTIRYHTEGSTLRLTLRTERELPPFSADIIDGRADDLPKGVLTERAAAMLGALDGVTLSGKGSDLRVAFWDVPEPRIIAAGTKLLAELAGGTRSVGAFR